VKSATAIRRIGGQLGEAADARVVKARERIGAAEAGNRIACIGRKKPTSRPHCDPKCSQRLFTFHFEGEPQAPFTPNLAPALILPGLFVWFFVFGLLFVNAPRRFPPPWSIEDRVVVPERPQAVL
jgi:hypothetical protein